VKVNERKVTLKWALHKFSIIDNNYKIMDINSLICNFSKSSAKDKKDESAGDKM